MHSVRWATGSWSPEWGPAPPASTLGAGAVPDAREALGPVDLAGPRGAGRSCGDSLRLLCPRGELCGQTAVAPAPHLLSGPFARRANASGGHRTPYSEDQDACRAPWCLRLWKEARLVPAQAL